MSRWVIQPTATPSSDSTGQPSASPRANAAIAASSGCSGRTSVTARASDAARLPLVCSSPVSTSPAEIRPTSLPSSSTTGRTRCSASAKRVATSRIPASAGTGRGTGRMASRTGMLAIGPGAAGRSTSIPRRRSLSV